jgi:hypothetical protein
VKKDSGWIRNDRRVQFGVRGGYSWEQPWGEQRVIRDNHNELTSRWPATRR